MLKWITFFALALFAVLFILGAGTQYKTWQLVVIGGAVLWVLPDLFRPSATGPKDRAGQ